MKKPYKKTITLDLDGVVHEWDGIWTGPRTFNGRSVDGAFTFIIDALEAGFDVAIHSSRSNHIGARWAMKRWFRREFRILAIDYNTCPLSIADYVVKNSSMDSWEEEVWWASKRLVKMIKWPKHKLPSMIYIDDRAYRFEGEWPSVNALWVMQPWWKKKLEDFEIEVPVGEKEG